MIKFLVAGIIVVFAWYLYKRANPTATGNTVSDDTKNIEILNPVTTSGRIVQTAKVNPLNSTVAADSLPTEQVSTATPKNYITNVSSINNVDAYRADAINNETISKALPIQYLGPPVTIDGSMYGTNLPDPSLVLQVPLPVIQTAPQVPIEARVTDNMLPAPTGVDDVLDQSIPIGARYYSVDRAVSLV